VTPQDPAILLALLILGTVVVGIAAVGEAVAGRSPEIRRILDWIIWKVSP
jgi:hypothetical protein